MAQKRLFGIFSPCLGEKKDFPVILLDKTVQTDNRDIYRKYGEIHYRLKRAGDMLGTSGSKYQTPDDNPILHFHTFIKRSTGTQYLLAFTKAHIYHWNTATKVWDTKFTCASDCTEWDTVTYNDLVIATNNVDKVLKWTTTGNFVALDDTSNGILYNVSYANETAVDETSTSGQKVLKVSSTTGYIANDKVIIGRGGDREEVGVVDTIQAGISLTLDDNLTYEHTANAETTVDANSPAGAKNLYVASTTGFSNGEWIWIDKGGVKEEYKQIDTISAGSHFVLGTNLTWQHLGADADDVVGTGAQNDTVEEYTDYYLTKAKHVTTFENFLILGYVTMNGVVYPQREVWNAIGDETAWRTGDAGNKETEGSDHIVGFKIYAGQLIIFKENTRIRQVLIPTSEVWNWAVLPGNVGCLSNHSIVEDADGRVYWAADDFTIREMEEGEISQDIDPIVKLIEPSSTSLVYATYIDETGELWWSIPYNNALNNKVITLKIKGGIIESWGELDLSIPAFGNYKEE